MHSFLSDESLGQLIDASSLTEERKEEYRELLAKLDEKGRAYLLDMLTDVAIVEEAREESKKAIGAYKEFSEDSDYDKLQKRLDEN